MPSCAEDTPRSSDRTRARDGDAAGFLLLLVVLSGFGLWLVAFANMHLAPMLRHKPTLEHVAQTLAEGRNFATFDLNIDIRNLRNEHIQRLPETPDLAVLGASHWQEGHADLVPGLNFYNAHVHRDYFEDMLAVAEMMVRHDRLPPRMIITIRDNLFTPIDRRTDFLWVPGLPFYRSMADRLGIAAYSYRQTLPFEYTSERFSLSLLAENLERWLGAPELPHLTDRREHETLDVLLPDGSINWSAAHQAAFTRSRALRLANEFAHQRRDDPPVIDAYGVEAINRLIRFLRDRGVEVTLAHPPFNPVFYDAITGTAYADGLQAVEQLTQAIADEYGLRIIGSFDPREVGCDASMYIDAEHAGPACLGRIFDQFLTSPNPVAGRS